MEKSTEYSMNSVGISNCLLHVGKTVFTLQTSINSRWLKYCHGEIKEKALIKNIGKRKLLGQRMFS